MQCRTKLVIMHYRGCMEAGREDILFSTVMPDVQLSSVMPNVSCPPHSGSLPYPTGCNEIPLKDFAFHKNSMVFPRNF